jgi:hypothetical protein
MIIKILRDFSYTPGPRYIDEGPNSGEHFRQTILLDAMRTCIQNDEILTIDLDGTAGYGRSFLEESFGGMVRVDKVPYQAIVDHLKVVSEEEPEWIAKIDGYLRKAHGQNEMDKKE